MPVTGQHSRKGQAQPGQPVAAGSPPRPTPAGEGRWAVAAGAGVAHPGDTHRPYCCPPSKEGEAARCLLGWGEAVGEMPKHRPQRKKRQLNTTWRGSGGKRLAASNLAWRPAYICGSSPAAPRRRAHSLGKEQRPQALSPAQTLGWKLTSPPRPMPRRRRMRGGGGDTQGSWRSHWQDKGTLHSWCR